MNPDFPDIIRALLDANVRFIIVGAYAVNLYVDPRAAVIQNKRATGRPKDIADLDALDRGDTH